MVAKAIAGKLAALGHSVKIGTRDPKATLAREEKDMSGGPPIRVWLEGQPNVSLATLAEAAAHGAIVFNALSGKGAVEALQSVGSASSRARSSSTSRTRSTSRRACRRRSRSRTPTRSASKSSARCPKAKVVKTLNTVNASLMVDPKSLAGGDHTMFVCGNDAGAKGEVTPASCRTASAGAT